MLFLMIALHVDQSPGSPGSYPHPGYPTPSEREDSTPKLRVQIDQPIRLYGERSEEAVWLQTKREASSTHGCYRYALNRDPSLYGELTVEFIIKPDGRVSGVRLLKVQEELEDEDLRQCLLRTRERIRFEETQGPVAAFTQRLAFSVR